MRLINLLVLLLVLSSATCAKAPQKDYSVIKWLPVDDSCFERLLPDGVVETFCIDATSNMIGISLVDYVKELNYQDRLIKSCQKWRK